MCRQANRVAISYVYVNETTLVIKLNLGMLRRNTEKLTCYSSSLH